MDLDKVDWSQCKKWAIRRVLEYGTPDEIREIDRFYGHDALLELFNNPQGFRLYDQVKQNYQKAALWIEWWLTPHRFSQIYFHTNFYEIIRIFKLAQIPQIFTDFLIVNDPVGGWAKARSSADFPGKVTILVNGKNVSKNGAIKEPKRPLKA